MAGGQDRENRGHENRLAALTNARMEIFERYDRRPKKPALAKAGGAVELVKTLFPDMPVQMCVFHQKQIVHRYLTGKPKTECGIAIKNLMTDLMGLSEEDFSARLQNIYDDYGDFLKERNPQKQFRHREVRSALRSLKTNTRHIFTYKRHPELAIPPTTNSCEGSFGHWKAKITIHRGLAQKRRSKMIAFLLANS